LTEQILRDIGYVEGQPVCSPESYNDIFYGSNYLQAVLDKKIQAGDMVLMMVLSSISTKPLTTGCIYGLYSIIHQIIITRRSMLFLAVMICGVQ
jgi:hypothetical protein